MDFELLQGEKHGVVVCGFSVCLSLLSVHKALQHWEVRGVTRPTCTPPVKFFVFLLNISSAKTFPSNLLFLACQALPVRDVKTMDTYFWCFLCFSKWGGDCVSLEAAVHLVTLLAAAAWPAALCVASWLSFPVCSTEISGSFLYEVLEYEDGKNSEKG